MQAYQGLYLDTGSNLEYIISGNTELLLNNPRAKIALKRLEYECSDKRSISISFTENTQISTLEAIMQVSEKLGIEIKTNSSVVKLAKNYKKELENFETFTNKAISIRNNKFKDYPSLVEDFSSFKEVLSTTMVRRLYDLQMLAAFHMAFSQNACNFAVPGAGKTTIVYSAYCYLKSLPPEDPRHVDKILVIGPLSSFAPWEKEYKKCFGTPPESQRLSGDSNITRLQKEKHLYATTPKELTLMNHAGLQYLEKQIVDFLKQNKVLLVVDEAHRIKNAAGIWGKTAVEISKEATGRVVLTGTPAPNGYEDLYNLIRFIYPFKYKQVLGIHYGQLKELTKAEATLDNPRVESFVENIKPFFIRIKKSDLNLPPVKEEDVWVPMDELQRKIYNFIEDKYIPYFEDKSLATTKDALNKARLIRLRQAAINPSMLIKPLLGSLEMSEEGSDPSTNYALKYNEGINDSEIFKEIMRYSKEVIPAKYLAIERLYREKIKPNKGKVIVWTIFIHNALELQKYLTRLGINSKLLIGRVPQFEREEIIDKFNNPKNNEFDIIIANPFSVSESISLHEGCHNAIYMERDYNAANFLQSKDRIHRVGLSSDIVTRYFYLISPDSVDEIVHSKLSAKVVRMEEIISQEIPLFARVHDDDETDIITSLLKDYARRTKTL